MRTFSTAFALAASLLGLPAISQPAFLSESDPAQQIAEACGNIDVADPNAVYDCLALRQNNAALNALRPTDDCRRVVVHLAFMVREAQKSGGNVTTSADNLPCESAAQVIYDASGAEPYWISCLGYDPANKNNHFRDCVIAYYVGRERRSQDEAVQEFMASGCDDLKRVYFQFAMPGAYKEREWPDGQIRMLPENIEDIACTDIATISFE